MVFSIGTVRDSFLGALLALGVPLFVWVVKSGYDRHRKEKIVIAKFERIHVNNLINLEDDIHLLKEWVNILRQNRPYTCVFGNFNIDDESHMDLSDVVLINRVLKTNSLLKRLDSDLHGIYNHYTHVISEVVDGKTKVKVTQLKFYNDNLANTLERVLSKIPDIQKEVIETIAHVRLAAKVRFHSFYGYFGLLFRDFFPIVTHTKIRKEVNKIDKEIEEKSNKE